MRITERRLREVIKSVISETADFHLVPKMVPKRGAGMASMAADAIRALADSMCNLFFINK